MRCPAGGLFSILLWGAKGSRDVKLPITVGPLKGGEKVRPALQPRMQRTMPTAHSAGVHTTS